MLTNRQKLFGIAGTVTGCVLAGFGYWFFIAEHLSPPLNEPTAKVIACIALALFGLWQARAIWTGTDAAFNAHVAWEERHEQLKASRGAASPAAERKHRTARRVFALAVTLSLVALFGAILAWCLGSPGVGSILTLVALAVAANVAAPAYQDAWGVSFLPSRPPADR